MKEDPFVDIAMDAASKVIAPPLFVQRGAALLYQVTVTNKLHIEVDPKKPIRGQSAFQTDICIFEQVEEEIQIPRVVLEFKTGITTHDIITYSYKARKHKTIYPYLRYGVVVGDIPKVTTKFFVHNDSLDFCVAASTYKDNRLQEILAKLLRAEVAASRQLEQLYLGKLSVKVFRNELGLDEDPERVT